MDSLKRLSGAKEVSQLDFSGGVATFQVKFDATPVVTLAGIRKEVGKYKVDKVEVKLTGKAVLKGEAWSMGTIALTGDMTAKLAELKGKTIIVSGVLTEDAAGKQSLALTSVSALAAK